MEGLEGTMKDMAGRKKHSAEDVVRKLRRADELAAAHPISVSVRPADLSMEGSAGSLARTLHREGVAVDILVNNAGVLQHAAFVAMTPDEHRNLVQLNVAGFTNMLAHFAPAMVARGSGRILNIASVAAFQPVPSLATYAATKAYVLSLSEALSEEFRGTGVTVTALCPGFTRTNMLDSAGPVAQTLPAMLVGDVQKVANEAFRACLKGTPIVVPGSLNLASTLAARATPRWLVRRFTGLMGRSTLKSSEQ